MPPPDNTPQAVIRHLTRVLSAVAYTSPDNEVRVKKSLLDQLAGEGATRALFEDFDSKTDEVVLRFRPKSLATYLIEETPCPTSTRVPSTSDQPSPSIKSANSLTSVQGRLPLTDEQLVRAENLLAKEHHLRAIRQEQQRSSSQSEGTL